MGSLRVSFCLSCAGVVVAYGCSGESSVGAGAGAHTGSSATAGRGGSHQGDAGDAGEGGHGATSKAGRPGSTGAAGKGEGGADAKGGVGAKGGAGGRKPQSSGGSATEQGGAGADGGGRTCTTLDLDEVGGAGTCHGEAYDTCCTGPDPLPGADYDSSPSPPTCGEPRTCTAVLCENDCRQDTSDPLVVQMRCCDDRRWHFVYGERQFIRYYEDVTDQTLSEPLSPPCGGLTSPSESALHFNGASELELPTRGTKVRPSFELWFRTTEQTGPLLSSTAAPYTLYLSGGSICFYPGVDTPEVCTTEHFADGAWHHAALAVGGTVGYAYGGVYADGALKASGEVAALGEVSDFSAGRGRIGASPTLVYFEGDLDEIRIWDESRNGSQIYDYHATRLIDDSVMPRLLGYWPLEETGSAMTTANLATPRPPLRGCDQITNPDEGLAGAGGSSAVPDGTLIDFSFATSPWLDEGAF